MLIFYCKFSGVQVHAEDPWLFFGGQQKNSPGEKVVQMLEFLKIWFFVSL